MRKQNTVKLTKEKLNDMESKFYSEGALGELNPTLKTVLDILKGISSVRGR